MAEMICYTNLFVFSAVRLKFGTDEIVNITAYVSGGITLVLLLVIISHHVYTTFCSKYLKQCRYQGKRQLDDSELSNDATVDTSSPGSYDRDEPTFSVVELKLPGNSKQVSRATNETDDENSSSDCTSPLLN